MKDIDQLGPCLAAYHTPALRRRRGLVVLLVLASAAALFLLVYALGLAYLGQTQYGPAAAVKWSRPWLISGASLGGASLLLGVRAALLSRRKVYVHANGLRLYGFPLWTALTGRTLLWNRVRGVSYTAVRAKANRPPDHFRLAIYLTGGRTVHLLGQPKTKAALGRFAELSELATRLKASLYPRLLPGYKQSFAKGSRLSFGPLAIQRSQLEMRRFALLNQKVAWRQVRQITVRSGRVVVELTNGTGKTTRRSYPVLSIPNFELLLQMVDEGVKP